MRKSSNKPFGFMRFKYQKETMRAIDNLNGLQVRGSKTEVAVVKYGRKEKGKGMVSSSQQQGEVKKITSRGIKSGLR